MNKLRKRLLSSTIFFVILVAFLSLSGLWNPFKKESWEKLGKDIEKGVTTAYKEVEKGVTTAYKEVEKGVKKEILVPLYLAKPKEPKIKGWAVRPTSNTKLHEFVWVSTHNAFSSRAHGYGLYRQQNVSMANQLKAGVRALALDVWVGKKGKVRLTHGPPKFDKILRPTAFSEGMEFVEELKRMNREFFTKNKKAVVFFILEDHVKNRALLTKSFELAGLSRKILKPSEWNPVAKKGWPTIGWMNKRGKQIVVFSTEPATKYIYKRSKTIVANAWNNKLDFQKASGVGVSKTERYLYLFNFFTDPAEKFAHARNPLSIIKAAGSFIKGLNYSVINGKKLRNAIYYAITRGSIVIRGRYPNFLNVDFVEKGNVFGIADELNKKARGKQSKVFRAIVKK